MDSLELPEILRSEIGSESYDFAIKAGPTRPFRRSVPGIAFGLLLVTVAGIFAIIFRASAGTNETDASKNPGSDTIMILLLGFFMLTGIVIMASSIVRSLQKGGYFAATPKRLIYCRKGKLSSWEWQKFTGETQVTGNEKKGTILLVMRTGDVVSNGKSGLRYVPNQLYITSIPDVFDVERMIRKRIKEKDPTPAVR
jgi:hypothetical protein